MNRFKTFLASLALTLLACGPAAAEMTLHYDFLNSPSLAAQVGPDLSITRATKATMVDADGYIREVQSGEARFTGATWRANLVPDSTLLTTSWIANGNGTLVTNYATAPDGTATAHRIIDDSSTGTGSVGWRTAVVNFKANTTLLYSVYLKADQLTWAAVSSQNFAASANGTAYINLSTGALGTDSVSTSNETVTDEGNGWYRLSFTINTDTDGSGRIAISCADGDLDTTVDLDGTSSILAWGPMIEDVGSTGRTTPSTYIATTASTPVSSLTGTSTKGLLVEEARTNICLQSEDLGTTWTIRGTATLTANDAVAPDGSTTADKVTGLNTSGNDFFQQITGGTSTNPVEPSFYIKRISTTGVLKVDSPQGTGFGSWDVDMSALSDSWERITSAHAAVTINNAFIDDTSGVTGILVRAASGGPLSAHFWGFQVERNVSFPTSYIATTTASVTRNADIVSTTDVSWFDKTQGSFYTKVNIPYVDGASALPFWQVDNGTQNDRYLVYQGVVATRLNALLLSSTGNDSTSISQTTRFTAGSDNVTALGYAQDDTVLYEAGTVVTTSDTTFDIPSATFTTFYVGKGRAANSEINGHIAEIRYYNERLADDVLSDLSQGIFPSDVTGTPIKAIMPGLSVGEINDEILCANSSLDDMPICFADAGSNVLDFGIHRRRHGQNRTDDSDCAGASGCDSIGDVHDVDRVVGF